MNFIKKFALTQVIKNVLSKLSADHKTTIIGVLGAALLAENIDWGKLAEGDAEQVGKTVSALVLAALGYFTNREGKPDAADKVVE